MAGLRFRRGFEFYQVRRISRPGPLARGIMVLVGVFEAHELDFSLSGPVGGNGCCLAGHRVFLGAGNGSSPLLLILIEAEAFFHK